MSMAEDMKLFLNSLVPVFLIFILVPGKVRPNGEINVTSAKLDVDVGGSATIFCSVAKTIDIREIHFWGNDREILNLKIQKSEISSKLNFSGTFETFKWIIKGSEYTCTDKTGVLEETEQVECPSTNTSSTLFLYFKTEEIASYRVQPSAYHSRLDISGTIWDLKIMLTDLSEKDCGSYTCKGNASNMGELKGNAVFLTVRGHGISLNTGTLTLASAMVLTSSLFLLY
ncbi:uncharacterized protein LOC130297490 isoform X2 [Hyla sarda]|uniref:uncharacterized protein LOC130297490 isoform X2 n=1 Tax=Hyla sarda TaxID=327740 RepID=UPI0024C20FDC|nr:uncharacterized protein LOC130297490 isoform X2 [Hyla sarda]